jgi:hypothetical protein
MGSHRKIRAASNMMVNSVLRHQALREILIRTYAMWNDRGRMVHHVSVFGARRRFQEIFFFVLIEFGGRKILLVGDGAAHF